MCIINEIILHILLIYKKTYNYVTSKFKFLLSMFYFHLFVSMGCPWKGIPDPGH